MSLRRAVIAIRVLALFTLLLNLLAAAAAPSLYAGLLAVFGALVVLVSFGFAFGQRIERRAAQPRRRRLLDTTIVWALAACAIGLVFADGRQAQRLLWFLIAGAVLVIESIYRTLAARLEQPR